MDSQTQGLAVSLISVGAIAAFVPARLAARSGRRPVFLWVAVGSAVFTVLTAFSVGLYDFIIYQCIARLFMVTAVGVGLARLLALRVRSSTISGARQ